MSTYRYRQYRADLKVAPFNGMFMPYGWGAPPQRCRSNGCRMLKCSRSSPKNSLTSQRPNSLCAPVGDLARRGGKACPSPRQAGMTRVYTSERIVSALSAAGEQTRARRVGRSARLLVRWSVVSCRESSVAGLAHCESEDTGKISYGNGSQCRPHVPRQARTVQ